MPWRKHSTKPGKYGPIYKIGPGIRVQKDWRGVWMLYTTISGKRKSATFGKGREMLIKAVKAGESFLANLDAAKQRHFRKTQSESMVPKFSDYSEKWFNGNLTRWKQSTQERYEEVLRIHLLPYALFKKPLNEISRRNDRNHSCGHQRDLHRSSRR